MARFNNVLLIEDDPITVFVCEKVMKITGFANDVLSKNNGSDALDHLNGILTNKLQTVMPDVIFLDINMPVMNGWDFLTALEKLKSSFKKLPRVFILSSTIDPEDYKKASLFTTVENFVCKPLMQEHLESIK